VEKSCGVSRIHSHVILEALAEEVRGSMLFTTLHNIPAVACGKDFSATAYAYARNDKVKKYVPYFFGRTLPQE
jgi:hypothetical protein